MLFLLLAYSGWPEIYYPCLSKPVLPAPVCRPVEGNTREILKPNRTYSMNQSLLKARRQAQFSVLSNIHILLDSGNNKLYKRAFGSESSTLATPLFPVGQRRDHLFRVHHI